MSQVINKTIDALNTVNGLATATLEPVFLSNGAIIDDKKAVVVNGAPVHVVSNRYKLLTNEDAFLSLAQAVESSNLDTTDMEVKCQTNEKGSRVLTEFIFPAHEVNVGAVNDKTFLRVVAKNSYDHEWTFSTLAGGFRLACANGQVIGNYMNAYSSRHNNALDMDQAKGALHVAAEMFEAEGSNWVQMANTPVSDQRAFNFIKKYLGIAESPITIKDLAENPGRAAIHRAWAEWNMHKESLGSTFWALYNVLTHIANYKVDGNVVPLTTRMNNEAKIATLIQSQAWAKGMAA